MIDRKLFFSWIRVTWFGWLLGIPIIIVLALIGEAVHVVGLNFWLAPEWEPVSGSCKLW